LLGDCYANRMIPTRNTFLQFKKGILHADYIMHLYSLLELYCLTAPKSYVSRVSKGGEPLQSIWFNTRSLQHFNEFRETFYPNGKKIVPFNIGELLTARGLAGHGRWKEG